MAWIIVRIALSGAVRYWKRDERAMSEPAAVDRKLAKQLVLDELFDLSLYQSLREFASGELRSILDRLIPIEARHLAVLAGLLRPARRAARPRAAAEAPPHRPRLSALRRSGDPSRTGSDRGVRRAEVSERLDHVPERPSGSGGSKHPRGRVRARGMPS
jgi:hypothetical protein